MRIQGAHLPAALVSPRSRWRPRRSNGHSIRLRSTRRGAPARSRARGAAPALSPRQMPRIRPTRRPISRRDPRSVRCTPDEQVQAVLAATRLPHRARPVGSGHRLARPGHLRRQRPHVRRRAARLRTDARRRGLDRADRPHLRARGSRRRRHVRTPHGLRRRASFPALRHAVRRGCDPCGRDQQGRGVEVHRHEQGRRRRQEGALHRELRTRRQPRGAAVEPDVGDGQLAVHHRQFLPQPLDADRRRPRNDGAELVAVGRDAGRLRQGLVSARRQRPAGLLPVSYPLRQLRDARSVRAGPRDRLARPAS